MRLCVSRRLARDAIQREYDLFSLLLQSIYLLHYNTCVYVREKESFRARVCLRYIYIYIYISFCLFFSQWTNVATEQSNKWQPSSPHLWLGVVSDASSCECLSVFVFALVFILSGSANVDVYECAFVYLASLRVCGVSALFFSTLVSIECVESTSKPMQ